MSKLVPATPHAVTRSASATAGGVSGLLRGFSRWFFLGSVDPGPAQLGSPLLGGLSTPMLHARRTVQFWFAVRALVLLALALSVAWAWVHPFEALAGLAALVGAAFAYFAVRERARGRLIALGQAPAPAGLALRRGAPAGLGSAQAPGSSALLPMGSLGALARALEALREADLARAHAALDGVEPKHLRSDELRSFEAARAWAVLLTGDRRGAAGRAVAVLPTGLRLLDEVLAPVCLENALHDPRRLERLLQAWDGSAAWDSSEELRALRAVALAKLGRLELSALSRDERVALVERCRGLGELELATALASAAQGASIDAKLGYR